MLGNGENDWGFAPNPARERCSLDPYCAVASRHLGEKLLHSFKTPRSGERLGLSPNPTRERRSLDPYYAIALR